MTTKNRLSFQIWNLHKKKRQLKEKRKIHVPNYQNFTKIWLTVVYMTVNQ